MPRGRGQPSPIDKIIDHDRDGNPITVAERALAALRRGGYVEGAAASAGIDKTTFYEWLKVAARARIRVRGDLEDKTITDHERRCINFSHAVDDAEAQYEYTMNQTLTNLAVGGIPLTTTTTKRDATGTIIETTERTSSTIPDARVIMWRLTRRFPTRYGDQIAVTGPAGGPVELSLEERASALADLVRRVKAVPKKSRAKKTIRPQPDQSAEAPRAGDPE